MISEEKISELKNKILDLERESLSRIEPVSDKQMIVKIMKLYEEISKDDIK